jgi:hypothetical protein
MGCGLLDLWIYEFVVYGCGFGFWFNGFMDLWIYVHVGSSHSLWILWIYSLVMVSVCRLVYSL